ncbi:MAG: DNA-directed RNA polymerase subunit P [Nanoarchaeota archaeon]|nr:DNA-directed RNA polymerase subunit P [Nanoarchaeota archaeon]MCG2718245.1 DNA-directed RNA polymerase subunit P [Nanoarchaeota archaeon]
MVEKVAKATKVKTYHCFYCDAKINIKEYLKKKVRCPYCGSKILYKQRTANAKVKAV